MQILATSGGFLPSEYGPFHWQRGPLIEHAIALAGNPDRPRICHLGTAHGDSLNGISGFYSAFAGSDVRASAPRAVLDAQCARRPRAPARAGRHLGRRRLGREPARGLARARPRRFMREAWEAGVVLAGVSAGSICWHVGGTTDSFGPDLQAVTNGLACSPTATACTTTPRNTAGRCCTGSWPTGRCRRPTPPTTASGCTTAAPSSSRPSPTVPTWRPTRSSGDPTAPRSRPGSSPACSRPPNGRLHGRAPDRWRHHPRTYHGHGRPRVVVH